MTDFEWGPKRWLRRPGPESLGQTIATHRNNYNLIRLFLAGSVILFHSFALTKSAGWTDYADAALSMIDLDLGGVAVYGFFFLSGLFVAQSFFRDKSVINFAVRRFCRLWPGLFACVATTALAACVLTFGPTHLSFLLDDGIYHYILSNAVFQLVWTIPGVFEGLRISAINGSIHTLPNEIKMYVVLALLGSLSIIRSRIALGITGVVMVAVILLFSDAILPAAWWPTYGRPAGAMFFAGVATFAVADHVRFRFWLLPACLAAAFVAPPGWKLGLGLTASALAMMLAGRAPLRWRPRADLSYGIYIYGWPSQQFVLSADPRIGPYTLTLFALLLSLGCAALSWRWIERPGIDFGRRLIAARAKKGSTALAGEPATWHRSPATRRVALLFLCFGLLNLMSLGASVRASLAPAMPLGIIITGSGPGQVKAGEGFNVQPSGESALWVSFDKTPPDGTRIVLDGTPLATTLGPASASALVPAGLTARPGDREIVLELRRDGTRLRSAAIALHVTP